MAKLLLSLLVFGAFAQAQFICPTCATEPTQLLNNIELAASKAELVAHTAKLALILENALVNTRSIGTPGNSLGQELGNITQVLQATQALNQATSNLPAQWAGTWTMPSTIPVTAIGQPGFHADFSKWNAAAQDSLRVAMMAGQLSHVQQSNAVGILTQIEGLLSVVDGRLKAMQMAASGSMRTAASVEKMHDTMLTQGSAQMTFNQYQLQKDMSVEMAREHFFTYMAPERDATVMPSSFSDIIH